MIRLADLIGKAEHHGDSEADLVALMRADRKVQDRRRVEQATLDLEADKETVPKIRRITRRRR